MAQGVLFDMDGTLILSNKAHARAWVEVLAEHGRPVAYERVVKLMGMGGDVLVPTLFPDLDGNEGEGKALADAHKQLYLDKYAETVKPAPGARELMVALRARGTRVLVATSSGRAELDRALETAGVADLLTEAATGDEAAQSKPAPDVVAQGLAKLDLPPSRVVMVGDSPYDITAAGRVGVKVVALRCGGFSDAELEGAAAIYDDPAELLRGLDESPLVQ
jgi:HAD superfamily hydrolase (TIGR01509 family)